MVPLSILVLNELIPVPMLWISFPYRVYFLFKGFGNVYGFLDSANNHLCTSKNVFSKKKGTKTPNDPCNPSPTSTYIPPCLPILTCISILFLPLENKPLFHIGLDFCHRYLFIGGICHQQGRFPFYSKLPQLIF